MPALQLASGHVAAKGEVLQLHGQDCTQGNSIMDSCRILTADSFTGKQPPIKCAAALQPGSTFAGVRWCKRRVPPPLEWLLILGIPTLTLARQIGLQPAQGSRVVASAESTCDREEATRLGLRSALGVHPGTQRVDGPNQPSWSEQSGGHNSWHCTLRPRGAPSIAQPESTGSFALCCMARDYSPQLSSAPCRFSGNSFQCLERMPSTLASQIGDEVVVKGELKAQRSSRTSWLPPVTLALWPRCTNMHIVGDGSPIVAIRRYTMTERAAPKSG